MYTKNVSTLVWALPVPLSLALAPLACGGALFREARIYTHTTHSTTSRSTHESHVSHEIESYTDRGRHMTAGPSGEMGAHGLERMQDMGDDRGSARRVPTRD